MRYKKPYTLVRRKNRQGKLFYRYRVWDPTSGKRVEISTGKKSRDSAEEFCEDLRQKGEFVPTSSPPEIASEGIVTGLVPPPLFSTFAKDWWSDDCPYCKAEASRGKQLSRTYRARCEIRLRKQILPSFGKLPTNTISTKEIDSWHLALAAHPRVANTALSTLQVMLAEAFRLGIIQDNPRKRVKPIAEKKKVRELFTNKEIRDRFFSTEALAVWNRDPTAYLATLVVSRSGARAGEVSGLQSNSILELSKHGWMTVESSWDPKAIKETKTKSVRKVPSPKELIELLKAKPATEGYLFSDDGGVTPISYFRLRKRLGLALQAIGISKEEQKRRGLGLHAFRHWLNTSLSGNLSDDAIRATIGHTTEELTDLYKSQSGDIGTRCPCFEEILQDGKACLRPLFAP